MLESIFKDSKSALAFAVSVIVCTLMLIGPKESGGVLDKAVTTYKEEPPQRASASSSAAASAPVSAPMIGNYRPPYSEGEEQLEGPAPAAEPAQTQSGVIRLDPVTLQPIGEVSPPPPAANE